MKSEIKLRITHIENVNLRSTKSQNPPKVRLQPNLHSARWYIFETSPDPRLNTEKLQNLRFEPQFAIFEIKSHIDNLSEFPDFYESTLYMIFRNHI